MLDIDKVYGFDPAMAKDGVKMVMDAEGKQFFVVRRVPNQEYERLLSKEYRRVEKIIKLETEDSEKLAQKIMAETLAKTVLVGWEGVALKGKKIEFSVENATKLLLDYPNLRDSIVEFAKDSKNFRPIDDPAEIKK